MLGNFLGGADQAIVTPEAQFISDALRAVTLGHIAATPEAVRKFISTHWRFSAVWDMDFPESYMQEVGNLSLSPADLVGEAARHLVEAYAVLHDKPNAEIWVDHTPTHLSCLRLIEKTGFEHATVHIVRDGRAVAASLAKVDWGPTTIAASAEWWAMKIAEAFSAQKISKSPDTWVRYEDIVSDPEGSLRRVCSSVGIPFSLGMTESKSFSVPSYTRSQHTAVGGGVQENRIEAWQKDLSPRDQEVFESIAGTLLDVLGYTRFYLKPRARSYLRRVWDDLIRHPISRRPRKRRNILRRSNALDRIGGAP